ncbi:nuclease-related domain-containing protein [Metasolibacillus meyeri]|uniref:Nuclease-related domain-containing protein n=1 Tax=Metasolibacillus meyeri TaxID=1071052 RepID=A0AAW9NLV6_9BACL|nr:nuclease-related domain-containing protein [Metasolibacillus meyeri]MEC1176930.1 nuclease-related domain-containing protein [Metasolibacillus meyeri]
MIVKCRKMPDHLLFLETLLQRNADLYEQYQRVNAGYIGELRVDCEWDDIFLEQEHYLFHDYQITNQANFTHQIDTLFICRSFILLIEVKHIMGRLDFEEQTHQFIRTKSDGTQNVYHNPIDQIERHRLLIETLLLKWGIELPVIPAIIVTSPSAHIGMTPPHYLIFHVTGLRTKLQQLFEKYSPSVTSEQLHNLKVLLLANYERKPFVRSIIPAKTIIGALCPHCQPTVRLQHWRGKSFQCPRCDNRFTDAIPKGLRDYKILFGELITNRAFRQFFGMKDVKVASKLLAHLNLESRGERKTREYIIPDKVKWGT